jgi:hypothetical protein
MHLTKSRLKQIIKEELDLLVNEQFGASSGATTPQFDMAPLASVQVSHAIDGLGHHVDAQSDLAFQLEHWLGFDECGWNDGRLGPSALYCKGAYKGQRDRSEPLTVAGMRKFKNNFQLKYDQYDFGQMVAHQFPLYYKKIIAITNKAMHYRKTFDMANRGQKTAEGGTHRMVSIGNDKYHQNIKTGCIQPFAPVNDRTKWEAEKHNKSYICKSGRQERERSQRKKTQSQQTASRAMEKSIELTKRLCTEKGPDSFECYEKWNIETNIKRGRDPFADQIHWKKRWKRAKAGR